MRRFGICRRAGGVGPPVFRRHRGLTPIPPAGKTHRLSDERGEPLWIITLVNKSSRPVGTIYIGATRGTVKRTQGMFAGTTMDDVETEYDAQEGGIVTGIEARIKRAFHRTQEETRGVFERVKHSFSDFINRE